MIKVKKNPTTKLMIVGLGLLPVVFKCIDSVVSESEACGYRSGVRVWHNGGIVLRGESIVRLEVYINR